jgi:hypothetical protein
MDLGEGGQATGKGCGQFRVTEANVVGWGGPPAQHLYLPVLEPVVPRGGRRTGEEGVATVTGGV